MSKFINIKLIGFFNLRHDIHASLAWLLNCSLNFFLDKNHLPAKFFTLLKKLIKSKILKVKLLFLNKIIILDKSFILFFLFINVLVPPYYVLFEWLSYCDKVLMERKESQKTHNNEVIYGLIDPVVRVKTILSEIMKNETVLLRYMTYSKFDFWMIIDLIVFNIVRIADQS